MADPIVQVNISRNTTGVKRLGFNTMLFIGTHRWFPERVRTYTSKDEVAEDVPLDSEEYIAASIAFAQSPSPGQFKIGRREADATFTPTEVVENKVFKFTITVNDGDYADVSYTAGAAETAQTVCDAFVTAIEGDAAVAQHVTVATVGTGASAVLTISATTATDVFSITNIEEFTYSFTSSETAAEVRTACSAEDDDWYSLATNDHTETFVLAMATEMEGLDRTYWVSTQQSGSISNSYSATETDIIAQLKQGNYDNTNAYWDEEADTTFPEVGYFHMSGPYTPGTVTWVNLPITTQTVAKNPTTGNPLSATERKNLDDRNCSYMVNDKRLDVNIVEGGKCASGEWIDIIRFVHYWKAKLEEAIGIVMVNQKGRKLGGDPGINKVWSACNTISDTMLTDDKVARGLDSYKFTFPRNSQITPSDRASRILTGTFVGYLTGAFHKVKIEGIVTYAGL